MLINRNQLLELYKELHKYGQHLKYTDKKYFFEKIRSQFLNLNINPEQTNILYKVKNYFLNSFFRFLI